MSVGEPFNIYREQLSSLYHGLALWDPKPVENLHNQPGHVSIGDVGYLDNGIFMRMFNVTLPWDDPSNKLLGKPPEKYERIEPSYFGNVRENEIREGVYRTHVSEVDNDVGANRHEDSLGQMYQCRAQHCGALLSLPHNGHSKDVIHRKEFEDYIRDNVDNWFRWSKKMKLPVDRMEDLILVTGCTLVTSWAAAAFDGYIPVDSDSDATRISLEAIKVHGGRANFFWRNIRGNVEYHNSRFDPNVQGPLPQNQCVFIRGFRAKRTLFRTIRMRAAAEPLPDDPDDRREDEIQVTRIPDSSEYRDPLVGILDYIIQKCNDDISGAGDIIAIAHDDDLRLIEGVGTLTANAIEEFLHGKQMSLLVKNGAAILHDPLATDQTTTEIKGRKFPWEIGSDLSRMTIANLARFKSLLKVINLPPRREKSLMRKLAERRMDRDILAVQWLVDNMTDGEEMEAFLVGIPGSFDHEWRRDVWKGVVRGDQSTAHSNVQVQLHPSLPQDGSTVYGLCGRVGNFLYAYNDEEDFMDTKGRQRRMRACVEIAASLVCCTHVELGLFGEVEKVFSKVLSQLGDKERTNDPLTIISNPLFTVRWTCLSLVTIWEIVDANMLQELATFALDGFKRLYTYYGIPDTMALMGIAQTIDGYLMRAWAPALDLHLAFDSEPWSLGRTESEIITILSSREESISELERIAIEATGVEEFDRRISFFQKRMDGITHELIQRLPGVFFNKLKSAVPIMISEAFDFPSVGTTPIPPPLIFPGQQIQSLCTLGRRLRDIIEGQNIDSHEDTLKSLESLREIPVSIRGLNNLMKRQLWRLLDLRDGRGLGFTIELFFLAIRQLSSTPSSSELEPKNVYYTGTFEVITSNWRSSNSAGTQRILLDLLCDLVIRSRGVFSDFSYPPYIVEMLLDLVGKMVKGHGGLNPLINEVIDELEDDNLRNRMDNSLRDQALDAICLPSDITPPSSSSHLQNILPPRAKYSLVYSTPRSPASFSASTPALCSSNELFYDNEDPDYQTKRRSMYRSQGAASSPDLATLVRKEKQRAGILPASVNKDKPRKIAPPPLPARLNPQV